MDPLSLLSVVALLLSLFLLFKVLELEKALREVGEYYRETHNVEKHILLLRKEFREIEEKFGDVGAIGRRLKELEEAWKPLIPKVEALERDVGSLKADVGRIDEVIKSLHGKVSALEELGGRLEALEGELKGILEKIHLLEENLTRMDTQVVQNRENMERLERALDKLSERLEGISRVVDSYLQFRDEVLSKVSEITTKMATTEGRVKKLESFVDYMRGVERNVREIKAKFEAFEKSKGLLFDLLIELKEEVKALKAHAHALKAPQVYETIVALQREQEDLEEAIRELSEELSQLRQALYELKAKYHYLTMPGREEVEFFKRELERIGEKVKALAKKV